jgi:DNA-binding transcriptional ArsR family regulator
MQPPHALTVICLGRNIDAVREKMWGALVHPQRRAVLALLRQRPHAVGELVDVLGLSQPGTSKHLRVLREAGLVRVLPDAQRRLYALEPAPLSELDEWLAPYRALWNDRLDALGHHLDETDDGQEQR